MSFLAWPALLGRDSRPKGDSCRRQPAGRCKASATRGYCRRPHALAKPKIQQQCGTGALIVRRLAADGADTVGVFVTNDGYNGVQQVLRLSTPLSPKPHQIKLRKRLIQNGEN